MANISDGQRRLWFAAIKKLGLDKTEAADLLEKATGKRSIREVVPSEFDYVVKELERNGFENYAATRGEKKYQDYGKRGKRMRYIEVLAKKEGALDNPTDKGLEAFIRKTYGVYNITQLSDQDLSNCIEALKAMLKRKQAKADRFADDTEPAEVF